MTYARCTTFDPRSGNECWGELEPLDEGGWRCPNCGVLDPSIDGSRCDECGTIEENWESDNLVCPRCLEQADEAPYAIASTPSRARSGCAPMPAAGAARKSR
jgi:DNA-directed RNA polymerase subunit RPC12/RpoP